MMKLLRTIDGESLPPEKLQALALRQAARAVVFDAEKNVALLHVKRNGYYKLPGGGVEAGEDLLSALQRECREEIGCDIEVYGEIGMAREYRGRLNVKQESFCFLAYVVGEKRSPKFTEEELADGFSSVWVSLDEAIRLMEEANTEDDHGKFIIPRDLVFLREAKDILSKGGDVC